MRERPLAVGIFNAGTAAGAALAIPIVSWIALTWNWRYAFVFGGALGIVWVVAWSFIYRVPREHPRLSAEELALIESDRAGGDCTWTGCIPSKTLLSSAHAAHAVRTADRYGVAAQEPGTKVEVEVGHARG